MENTNYFKSSNQDIFMSNEYLAEFYRHHNLSNLSVELNPIRNLIQYNFGVDFKYITKKSIKTQESFIRLILNHSKSPSSLEKDTDNELKECLSSFSK